MIVVFGSINVDLLFSVDALPRAGETVLCPGHRAAAGGKGLNQAVGGGRAADGWPPGAGPVPGVHAGRWPRRAPPRIQRPPCRWWAASAQTASPRSRFKP